MRIGNQCWMRKVLKATKYSDVTFLIDWTNAGSIASDFTTKYYFDYSNNVSNTAIYSKLYTYSAVINGSASSISVPSGVIGICPAGWHLPSDAEWIILTTFLGGKSIASNLLKESGNSHCSIPNCEATNSTNFTALPAGLRLYTVFFLMDMETFQFLNQAVNEISKIGIKGLVSKCPKCESEVHTPLTFPGGAKNIFVLPNIFNEFIKK